MILVEVSSYVIVFTVEILRSWFARPSHWISEMVIWLDSFDRYSIF